MIDLNLLSVAESLFRHRNVSKTARELGLSQPAISHALSKLRDHYQDPLFVRISRGVAPTPFALSIQSDILRFVEKARDLSRRQERFDPTTAKGRVVISSTDYFEAVCMPKFIASMQKLAPGLQISLRPTAGELPKAELEGGNIDIALAGFYQKMPEGFYRSTAFEDEFSIAMRRGHPLAKRRLTETEYLNAQHAHIAITGDFKDDLGRVLYYGSYSFTGPAWVVAESDLILTAPTRLLSEYARYFPIVVQPCPVQIDSIRVHMVWHEMTHQDPMKKWVREKLKQISSSI